MFTHQINNPNFLAFEGAKIGIINLWKTQTLFSNLKSYFSCPKDWGKIHTLQLYAYRVKYKSTLVWFDHTWTTDKTFTVERWDEKGNYQIITEVGEESRLQNGRYQISDPKPEQGFNTYRVRMNLEEDYFMTSNRATLWFPKAERDYILVPNPATHKVDLIFSEVISSNTEGAMIEIFDINGRLQRQSILDQEELLSYYRLFLDDLPSGIYVVVLRQSGQKPIARKLVLNDY